jgi:hypothetical protein
MGWSDREELVVVLEDGASPLIFYWAE